MNEPAFPYVCDADFEYGTGMTLRDYFAAKAVQGFNNRSIDYGREEEILISYAKDAYALADAMLKVRNGNS